MIDLPSCSAVAARALSDLAQRLPARFDISGTEVVASLLVGERPSPPPNWYQSVAMFASYQALVSLAPEVLPRAAVAHWPEIEQVGIPDTLRDILRGLLLDDIATNIGRLSGEAVRWSAAASEEGFPHAVSLARSTSMVPVATIGFDERTLAWIATWCADFERHSVAIDDLVVALDLIIDRIVISRAEVASLAPRDLVLLDRSPVDRDGKLAAVLCMPGFPGFRVSVAGGRASLESSVDAAMDNPAPPPVASIDDVPLVIDCDVGRVSLTIARLRELSVGQVLDLGLDATSRVSLRLNGQVIATGELVRIAERTGVRITDVLLSRAK